MTGTVFAWNLSLNALRWHFLNLLWPEKHWHQITSTPNLSWFTSQTIQNPMTYHKAAQTEVHSLTKLYASDIYKIPLPIHAQVI